MPSELNPADVASRGVRSPNSGDMLLWLRGPEFLLADRAKWPQCNLKYSLPEDDIEVRRTLAVMAERPDSPVFSLLLTRASTWTRLLRSVAWLRRFINYFAIMLARRTDGSLRVGLLQAGELEDATRVIVKLVQRDSFGLETSCGSGDANRVNCPKWLAGLRPVLRDGMLCVGGRVNATIGSCQNELVILPPHHELAKMIVKYYHEREGHMGASHVLARTREKFWIIKGMATVRWVLASV